MQILMSTYLNRAVALVLSLTHVWCARLHRAIGYIEDNREELNLDVNSLVICGGVAANQELRR